VVWKAKDTTLDRIVAIKFLHEGLPLNSILAEARKQAKVKSEHVVTIHDVKKKCIVTEYLPNSLENEMRKRIREGRGFDYSETIRLLGGISKGIFDAHQAGIIHGDIKPGNVLLHEDLTPKVSDFGVARSVGKQEHIFGWGSSTWMAPEILEGAGIEKEADCFSLGLLAYLLLSGRHPFYSEDPSCLFTVADNIKDERFKIQSLPDLPDMSPKLGEAVLGLLSRDMKERTSAFEKFRVMLLEAPSPEPMTCSSCGAPNQPGSNFCNRCGKPLITTQEAAFVNEIDTAMNNAKEHFFVLYLPVRAIQILDEVTRRLEAKKPARLADCWSLKAFIQNSASFWKDAEHSATRGIELDSNHVNSYHARGYARFKLGGRENLERAKDDLEKALGLTADDKKKSQIAVLLDAVTKELAEKKHGSNKRN